MTDDIVARLRDIEGGYSFRAICREAADEIERLRAERDEARLQTQRILNEIGLAGHNEAAADEENDLDPPRGGQWVDDGSDDDDEKSDYSQDFNIT